MRANWNETWTVTQREVLSVLRTKSFWILSIAAPILIGMPFASVVIEKSFSVVDEEVDESAWQFEVMSDSNKELVRELFWGDPVRFSIEDQTGVLYKHIRFEIIAETLSGGPWFYQTVTDLQKWELENEDSSTKLRDWATNTGLFEEIYWSEGLSVSLDDWVENGSIEGYFVIPIDLLTTDEPIKFVRKKPASMRLSEKIEALKNWFSDIVPRAMRQYHLEAVQIDPTRRPTLMKGINISIERIKPSLTVNSTESTSISTPVQDTNLYQTVSLVLVILFIFVLSGTSNMALTSTIEEKSNRLGELLVSSVDATRVLDGKLLASAIAALIGITACCLVMGPIFGAIALYLDYVSEFLAALLNPIKVINWFVFLLLGMAFYGYIEIALGSLCHNTKETMMTLYPVRFFYTFSVWPVLYFVLTKPNGTLAEILSFVPMFTPYVMIARADSLPTWPTYVAIVVLMLLCVFVVRKFAKTLFTNGILLEQTPTSLGKIFRLTRRRPK
ncbi:MAG: ABC transporter permease [Gammaproteobacteria bacterium]|nr:ABC transporter permease [Gammaproteobacteria bacterium]